MAELRRYGRVYLAFVRNCLIREMEFRTHFFLLILSKLLWSVLSLAFIGVIATQVDEIAGWTLDQMIVLTGSYLLVVGLSNILFFPNMARLSEYVNRGELDFILIKPLASQFLVSARYATFSELPATLIALGYVVVGLARQGRVPSAGAALVYALCVLIALTLIYAIWFMTVTLVIWSGRIENIHFLVYPFLEVARVPSDVFVGALRAVVTFALPIAFIATVPARALLGLLDPRLGLYGAALAVALLLLSRRVWTLALRRYTSASS